MWIFFTLICINSTENERENERRREREIDGGDVYGCSFGEPSRQKVTFQAFLCIRYITIETKKRFVLDIRGFFFFRMGTNGENEIYNIQYGVLLLFQCFNLSIKKKVVRTALLLQYW